MHTIPSSARTACALAFAALLAAAPLTASAADYKREVNMKRTTGIYPLTELVEGADGRMVGTASQGDDHGGSVFRVDSFHHLTVLHAFPKDGSQGWQPNQVILGSDGAYYGSTSIGASLVTGTIYRLTPDGTYQTLHTFTEESDGGYGFPSGPMVRDATGTLYVSLAAGGPHDNGAIARLATDGTLTLLHAFAGGADGSLAIGGLTLGPDGRLYGTTRDDGAGSSGTVFTLATDGSGYQVLHQFDANADGCDVEAPLAVGPDGALYGTTSNCGGTGFAGALFRVTRDGATFGVVHKFTTTDPLGNFPAGGVSFGPDGTMYSATPDGGAFGGGAVFKMSLSGTGTLMHSFRDYPSVTDGSRPFAAPTVSTTGAVWGTTFAGGLADLGTVYSIDHP